jgi:hypothetical protein
LFPGWKAHQNQQRTFKQSMDVMKIDQRSTDQERSGDQDKRSNVGIKEK